MSVVGAAEKRFSLHDAAVLVRDGNISVAPSCRYSQIPCALLLEVTPLDCHDLMLARNLTCLQAEASTATRFKSGWVRVGVRRRIPKVFRRFVERNPPSERRQDSTWSRGSAPSGCGAWRTRWSCPSSQLSRSSPLHRWNVRNIAMLEARWTHIDVLSHKVA